MQPRGRVSKQVAVLVYRAALGRHVAPEGGQRLLQPGAAVDNQELWLAQPALDEIVENERHAWLVSPPMFLTANRTFWPSSRTPRTTRSAIEVAFRSSRTRTTVPS